MKLNEIFEGLMKRSNPFVSGDRDGPNPTSNPWDKKSAHTRKIEALAKKANVQLSQVSKIWDEERDKVDKLSTARWAIVMNNVKKRLKI
jgi:hypothetical protein